MQHMIKEVTKGKTEICRKILNVLPEWFGLQEAKENYIKETENFLMLGCFTAETDECVGFLSLKDTTSSASEIFVMGIHPDYHLLGCGRSLINEAIEKAKKEGKEFLFVKTLSSSHPDPYYEKTRHFYKKVGFKELEVLPTIWGKENPCLVMVKNI